ncbi:DUF2867 domain-containing protein [Thalassospira marina]|uniref:DUF2867 domain-containing protein n=1 Tax=Thalassospira marina TaxID=2048283 RepID=A0ABM6Q7G7_9PROT|nr:DUF2867 domain-containing protein [Thalassospira marina]AUG51905.1 hypothetical protein CSC3H3_03600 [Thalassospira marina]
MVQTSVVPVSLPHISMPNADWADAFSIRTTQHAITPEMAAHKIMSSRPDWVVHLMRLRDTIVRPFGLKSGAKDSNDPNIIGLFPVIARSDTSITLGLDDRHLDFRLVVETEPCGTDQTLITTTTLTKRHNLFGRAYLATIMPFHRVIVPTMLKAAFPQ